MATYLISGGSGMIGRQLTKHLIKREDHVIILGRKRPRNSKFKTRLVTYAEYDTEAQTIDESAIKKADFVVHLAGANVAERRWTAERKKEILESRTKSAATLVKAMNEIPNNIKAVFSASAIGWYGEDTGRSKAEKFRETDPAASDFLGQVCKEWEASIKPVMQLSKRLVIGRFGIVLSRKGGALAQFRKPLKVNIAGILGSGKQVVSWIHIDDLCRMIIYALDHEEVNGVYNAVAPQPVTNEKLTTSLAEVIKGDSYMTMHVPAFLLRLMLGEMSTEVLKSATVSADKILQTGYPFKFGSIRTALDNLFVKNA